MLVASLVVAACSGSDVGTADDAVPTTPSTTSDAAPPNEPDAAEPPIEALEALWDSTLAVFASAPDERAGQLDELGDRVPDDVAELAPVYFPVSLTIESNAKFVATGDGDVGITDCAFTSEPTLLGIATAGFEATGRWDSTVERWRLADLDYVKQCVPVELADPALAAAEQYSDDIAVAWNTLDDEHPVLTDGMTEENRAEVLNSIEAYRSQGWIAVTDIERESYEVTGLLRQDGVTTVLISRCTHFGDAHGTFVDGGGPRVEEIPVPDAVRAVMRMSLSDDEVWRFSGFGEVEEVDCLDAPTDRGAQLL